MSTNTEARTTERVTADQVRDAVADVACLPLGVSMPEWQRISAVFLAAARQIESFPADGDKLGRSPLLAGEAFVAAFKREPSSPSDCAWMNGYDAAYSAPEPGAKLTAEQVGWIVNDNAELGVKIGEQFFFLYKGGSLVYEDGKHDNGTPLRWRPVFKREFGECCNPVNYEDLRKCGYPHYIGTVSIADSDEWKDLPQPPTKGEQHD